MTLTEYVSIKEGERELTSIVDSVDASIHRLEDYREKHGGKVVTTTRNNTDNTMINRTIRKHKWVKKKQQYGHFK